jgi:hypothetical protein
MQRLAWEWLRSKEVSDIYVPEVYRIFRRDGQAFIIMELVVDADPLAESSVAASATGNSR